MSFGTESSTPVGGQTLTGFIVSKAMQSRKDAKKEDRKQKRKEKRQQQSKKEDKQQQQKPGIGSKLLGSFPSLGNLFSYKKPETKGSQQAQRTRTSGGTTGLAKILTQGFGSLSADTMGLASGLASVTQLLNSSLKAQTFTATGVQTITSILSDQVENQGSILSTVKSLKPGGGSGGGGKSMFGSAGRSAGVGGDTLTGFVWNKIKDQVLSFLGGAAAGQLGKIKNLFNPKGKASAKPPSTPTTPGASSLKPKPLGRMTGSYDRFLQGTSNFGDRMRLLRRGQIGPGQLFTKGGVDSLAKPAGGGGSRSMFNLKNFKLPNLNGLKNLNLKGGGRGGLLGTAALMGAEIFKPQLQEASSNMWASLGVGPTAMSDEELRTQYNFEKQKIERARAYRDQNPLLKFAGEPEGVLDGYNVLREEMQKRKMKFASGGVMLGEAGKEAVVDLNSNQGRDLMGQQKDDPGMKASGASTLAVVDQFIKGMGPLGAPVSQALGPDISNLARTFGMSQSLPNLKIGGGKFKEDGNAKKTRDKFLEDLIAGSLKGLDAKKKDDKKVEKKTPPPGDPNAERSQQRQSETKEMLERIPGAGKAMEIAAPSTVEARQGETAFQTENAVRGTEVKLASGDRLMVPSADLNPVTNSRKKYWYDNKGQIFKWSPGEKVTQVFLNQVQQEGAKHSFDLVRNIDNGVVRQVPASGDWNPFNNSNKIKPGEYSYRAHGVLTKEKGNDGKPVWDRNDSTDDIQGIHGPTRSIPKQSNLTQFQRGGQVEQKPWWDFMGRFVDTHRNTKPQDYSNQQGIGANLSRRRQMMKELGYQKGGSLFGTESSNVIPLEQRVKALEDIIAVTSITSVSEPQKKITPRASASSSPIGATNQTSSGLDSAMIVNVIGGGDSGQVVTSEKSSQSTTDYISDPWPGGLAGVLCSSPWSVV